VRLLAVFVGELCRLILLLLFLRRLTILLLASVRPRIVSFTVLLDVVELPLVELVPDWIVRLYCL
jgi:hypothetical protein